MQTTCPLICEPGKPRARYAVLPVDFYVDSDDGHAMLVFRWFYKKSDIDRKGLNALKKDDPFDARDELALGRGIYETPLEYVRGRRRSSPRPASAGTARATTTRRRGSCIRGNYSSLCLLGGVEGLRRPWGARRVRNRVRGRAAAGAKRTACDHDEATPRVIRAIVAMPRLLDYHVERGPDELAAGLHSLQQVKNCAAGATCTTPKPPNANLLPRPGRELLPMDREADSSDRGSRQFSVTLCFLTPGFGCNALKAHVFSKTPGTPAWTYNNTSSPSTEIPSTAWSTISPPT